MFIAIIVFFFSNNVSYLVQQIFFQNILCLTCLHFEQVNLCGLVSELHPIDIHVDNVVEVGDTMLIFDKCRVSLLTFTGSLSSSSAVVI